MCQIFIVFIATCWRQFQVRRLKGFPLLIQLALLPERYIWYDVRMNNRIIENPNAIETSQPLKVRPAKVRRCPTDWWGSIARLVGGGPPRPAYFWKLLSKYCQSIARTFSECRCKYRSSKAWDKSKFGWAPDIKEQGFLPPWLGKGATWLWPTAPWQ